MNKKRNEEENNSPLDLINDSEKTMATRTTRSKTKVQNITQKYYHASHQEDKEHTGKRG